VGAHGAGPALGWRRVSWRTGRCRRAPGLTELSAPRPVALATTSITGFLFFGGKKLGTKLGQEVSRRRGILIQRAVSASDLFHLRFIPPHVNLRRSRALQRAHGGPLQRLLRAQLVPRV
jgi:hypothetical protein